MYDLGIWKIVFLWSKSSLGNIKVSGDGCAAACDSDWAGNRRPDLPGISDPDFGWNCGIDSSESIIGIECIGHAGVCRNCNKKGVNVMSKLIHIPPLALKEEKLQDIADHIEDLKKALADILDEYESEEADSETLDTLTEALDALEDAFDAVNEIVMDEL